MITASKVTDYVVTELCRRMLGVDFPLPALQQREYQILLCLGRGMTPRQIALELHLSRPDISNRLTRLMKKTGLSRGRLTTYGALLGVSITPPAKEKKNVT